MNAFFIRDLTEKIIITVLCFIIITIGVMLRNGSEYIVFHNSGYTFDKGIEPSFIERNWLMHGMTDREVSEEDCIKLFKVNGSLRYVLHALFGTDYGQ